MESEEKKERKEKKRNCLGKNIIVKVMHCICNVMYKIQSFWKAVERHTLSSV